MNRESFVEVLGYDPDKWAERYGLTPFSRACLDCGVPLVTTIPIAHGTLRGLAAPPCECGATDTPPYCFVREASHGDLFSGEA